MWYEVFRQKLKREICFRWDSLTIHLNNSEMERKVFVIILILKCYVSSLQGYERSWFLWVKNGSLDPRKGFQTFKTECPGGEMREIVELASEENLSKTMEVDIKWQYLLFYTTYRKPCKLIIVILLYNGRM